MMRTVKLRHTDLTVSRACFGTMTFGSQVDIHEAERIFERALERDINFFDTANIYNQGASETMLGRLIAGRRNRIVLASKVRGKWGEATDEAGLSRAAMRKALDASLRRLGTDYLDLYYLHMPDPAVPIEESLETMDEFVRAGKVRYPATSNYAAWQVTGMLWLAEKHGWKPATLTQPMYNLLGRALEAEYLPMCRQFGVSTIVYNPLAGGLLTGKQPRLAPVPGSRFDNNRMYLDRYWHPAQFDAVDRLRDVAAAAGRSLVSLSLNWLLHHTPVDCVILGASKLEQLDENLSAMEEGPLTDDALAACDRVWQQLRGVTPAYIR